MRCIHRPALAFVEILENRIAPATHVWVGPVSGGTWSVAANWSGGVPTSGEVGGTIVEFDGNISSTDNIVTLTVDELHFTAGGNTISGSNGAVLTINGSVLTNNIVNDVGNNTIASSLPLMNTGAATFVSVPAGKLTIASNISGTQGLNLVSGPGTLQLSGPLNTYGGTTTVSDGTLELNSIGFSTAVMANLIVGNDVGGGGTAIVRLLQGQEIGDNSTVTVRTDGLLDFNDQADTIGALNLESGSTSGATVSIGTGSLTLGGNVTLTSVGTGATPAMISGTIDLGSAARAFNIADGTAGSDLIVLAHIIGGAGITKTGTGTLELANSVPNTTGAVTVGDGTLLLNSTVANGAVTGDFTVGDGAGATASAKLVLGSSAQIPDGTNVQVRVDGRLDLNGFDDAINALALDSGTSSGGRVITGTGTLTLGADVIVFLTGTGAVGPSISGKLDLGSTAKTFLVADGAAAVDLAISAQILGSGGYIKASTGGLLVLGSGPSGPVKVNAGSLILNSSGGNDAIQSVLEIGTDSGTPASVRFMQDAEISDTATVIVRTDGTLDLSGHSDTIGSLQLKTGTAAASTIVMGAGSLTLNGSTYVGVTGTGATPVTIPGSIDFGGNSINVNDGSAASDLIVTAQITGTTGYSLYGGTMEVRNSGPMGPVTVVNGTLVLNSSVANSAIRGDLTLGSTNAINSPTVRLAQAQQIADTSTVTVSAYSTLDLNGNSDSIGSLVVYAGAQSGSTVTTGVAALGLTGDLSLKSNTSGATGATISGFLTLSAGVHTFDITDSAAASDLKIAASIFGAGALTKSGKGTLELANDPGDNMYTGDTTIADGVLLLTAPASGDSTSGHVIVGDGVGGAGTAVLRLGQLNVIDNSAAITVLSDGIFDVNGEIDSVGTVTVASKGILSLGSGRLTSSGALTLASDAVYAEDAGGKTTVVGSVTLGGQLAQTYTNLINVGTQTTIIDNDGTADPVIGTFAGLPEGAVFGTKAGLFKISYAGGDGNDVVVTSVDASTVLTISPDGKSAAFTDVDGDLVTVKTTKGAFTANQFEFGSLGSGFINGYQLQGVFLQDPSFQGAKVTFTAKPGSLGGNGHVNVGAIYAFGRDLASVTIPGDLNEFQAGDNDSKTPGIGKLTVDSMGLFGTATQRLGDVVFWTTNGAGSIVVKGDLRGTDLSVGNAGGITIGGSLIGDTVTGRGNVFATTVKKVTIGGSVIDAAGTNTGQIVATGDLGGVTIGHDLIGSAIIRSGGKLGSVAIKGDVFGATVAKPAIISGAGAATAPVKGLDTAIGGITIGRSVENLKILGGYDSSGSDFSADAAVGRISIGGDFRSSSILVGADAGPDGLFGTVDDTKEAVMRDAASRFSTIASLIIKGQATGTTTTGDFFGIEAEQIISASIGGKALKLKPGPRSSSDVFGLGYASAGPGNLPTDFYLREIIG